jgi:hypothetical protein
MGNRTAMVVKVAKTKTDRSTQCHCYSGSALTSSLQGYDRVVEVEQILAGIAKPSQIDLTPASIYQTSTDDWRILITTSWM